MIPLYHKIRYLSSFFDHKKFYYRTYFEGGESAGDEAEYLKA